jgi:hypothetical protein
MNKIEITQKIIDFLTKIGIKTQFCTIDKPTFLPGLNIQNGEIRIDMDKLAYPGDLLHEAGHIAVTESAKRSTTSDDAFTDAGEEIVAILWSYAAAKEIELPLEILFHPEGYKNSSKWIIESFESQTFMGLPLLEWMQMTAGESKAKDLGIAPFPKMIKWLRD